MEFKGGKEAIESRWAEEKALTELERQSYDIQEGSFSERIPRTRQTPELSKMELPQYSTGDVKVYLVNGQYIRDNIDIDFTQGGHGKVYKFIPENEIWIDRSLDTPEDKKATFLHELAEYNAMGEAIGKNTAYEQSHTKIANPLEVKARQNPDIVDEMIEAEMDKLIKNNDEVYREPARKVKSQGTYSRKYLGRRLRPPNLNISF
jgi:hypothetical protein